MDIVGDRKFIELPGSHTYELPPLLVRFSARPGRMSRIMDMAQQIAQSEIMDASAPLRQLLSEEDLERRRYDLALNLIERYASLVRYWHWGDGILAWIQQCEKTFEWRSDLKNLINPNIWPHAGRISFVNLLEDKAMQPQEIGLRQAVGLRLAFRQPPPISCVSEQFLFYLNTIVATTAYDTWASMSPAPVSVFPPERFTFQVVNMDIT